MAPVHLLAELMLRVRLSNMTRAITFALGEFGKTSRCLYMIR